MNEKATAASNSRLYLTVQKVLHLTEESIVWLGCGR